MQKNSGHNIFLEDPDQLTDHMIGFFEGHIKGIFDLKTSQAFFEDEAEK